MKRVVTDKKVDEIYIGDCDMKGIYASFADNGIYILTNISGRWAFVGLSNPLQNYGGLCGTFDSFAEAMKKAANKGQWRIYKFKSQQEFAEWAYEKTKAK